MKINKVKLEMAIKSFEDNGRDIVLNTNQKNHNSCVFMSRIAVAYFKKIGIKAKMIECHFASVNLDTGESKGCSRYTDKNNAIARMNGVPVITDDVSGLRGHVVVIIEDSILFDVSFGQFGYSEYFSESNKYEKLEMISDYLREDYGNYGYPTDVESNPVSRYDFKRKLITKFRIGQLFCEYYSIAEDEELNKEEKNSSAWIETTKPMVREFVKRFKKGSK